ncbi:hypothetical protein [Algoriphagus antarcticus]|uniref:hypothetical protein n=1 Tax=Algoriphagus antarcticus TaxID=238540 RepID=UPI000A3A98BD|nr:hypothetical protein [Algoriphagus antarcticus]
MFVCTNPLPDPEFGNVENKVWDGHCWLEFGGLVADASFFRTIYFGDIPSQLRKDVVEKFGEGRGSLIGALQQMEFYELSYLPKYCLTNFQIDALIKCSNHPHPFLRNHIPLLCTISNFGGLR